MNRFAILKDLPPPPFKDDIAKEISEAVSKYNGGIRRVGTPIFQQAMERGEREPPVMYGGPSSLAADVARMARVLDPSTPDPLSQMGFPSNPNPTPEPSQQEIDPRELRQAVNYAVQLEQAARSSMQAARSSMMDPDPGTGRITGRFDPAAERQINDMGRSLRYPVTHRVTIPARDQAMAQSTSLEEVYLTVTTPTGRHYRIGRDQIHIHQRGGSRPVRNPEYELHLNLPNNLAIDIWDDLGSERRDPTWMDHVRQQHERRRRIESLLRNDSNRTSE